MEFDLRYTILIIVNILKSIFISNEWDPFHIFVQLTFMAFMNRLFLLLLFSFIFSITSITIHYPMRVHISSTYFSKSFNILFLTSFLLPQVLFWYIFFITIMTFPSNWISNFKEWSLYIISIIPGFSIFINAELDRNNVNNQHPQAQTIHLLLPV